MIDGGRGLAPENVFKVTPSRTSENSLLEQEIKVSIIIDICAQMENDPLIWKRKTNSCTQFLLVPYACSPTQEANVSCQCADGNIVLSFYAQPYMISRSLLE